MVAKFTLQPPGTRCTQKFGQCAVPAKQYVSPWCLLEAHLFSWVCGAWTLCFLGAVCKCSYSPIQAEMGISSGEGSITQTRAGSQTISRSNIGQSTASSYNNSSSSSSSKIVAVSGDSREPSFLFQCISVIIQRFSSVLLHSSFPSDEEWRLQLSLLILCFVFNPQDLYYQG